VIVETPRSFQLENDNSAVGQMHFLIVETQGELYAVRWTLVREAGVLLRTDIDLTASVPEVHRDGMTFSLVHLWELIELTPPAESPAEIPAVFLEEGEKRIVLVPDRILWKQKGRLEGLPDWIVKAPAIAGAIVLSSGVVVVVLEPLEWKRDGGREE
jgi:chemotaxis protein histidine kinase CheA